MSKTVANYDYAMSELEALVAANNMHAALRIDQGLEKPNPATFFGKGKVVEIKEVAAANDLHIMVINADLTPSQVRNLEEQTDIQIIDRTGLILEILVTVRGARKPNCKLRLPNYNTNFPDYERVSPIALTNRLGPLLVVAGALPTVVLVKRNWN